MSAQGNPSVDGPREKCGNDAARPDGFDVSRLINGIAHTSARTPDSAPLTCENSRPLESVSGSGAYAGTLTAAMAAAARGDLEAVELLVSLIPASCLRSAVAALVTSYVGALLMHSPGAGEEIADDMARLIAGWERG